MLQTTMVEACSGSTGICISLALIAKRKGLKIVMFIPYDTLADVIRVLLITLDVQLVVTRSEAGIQVEIGLHGIPSHLARKVNFILASLNVWFQILHFDRRLHHISGSFALKPNICNFGNLGKSKKGQKKKSPHRSEIDVKIY